MVVVKRRSNSTNRGVTDIKHVEEAVGALDVKLTADDMRYLEELYRSRELTGHYGGQPAAGDAKP